MCDCVRMTAVEADGKRGRGVCGWGLPIVIWEEACLTEFKLTWIAPSQHANSDHFNSFTSTNLMAQSTASEVFIPNPVHNLMAFESLPLPPGWQVVHLDLIESIYILHKWKTHGGLPTWFWSATELGETLSLEYASCQQGYTVQSEKTGRERKEVTPFDAGSNCIQFEFSHPFTFCVSPSVQAAVFHSGDILPRGGVWKYRLMYYDCWCESSRIYVKNATRCLLMISYGQSIQPL